VLKDTELKFDRETEFLKTEIQRLKNLLLCDKEAHERQLKSISETHTIEVQNAANYKEQDIQQLQSKIEQTYKMTDDEHTKQSELREAELELKHQTSIELNDLMIKIQSQESILDELKHQH